MDWYRIVGNILYQPVRSHPLGRNGLEGAWEEVEALPPFLQGANGPEWCMPVEGGGVLEVELLQNLPSSMGEAPPLARREGAPRLSHPPPNWTPRVRSLLFPQCQVSDARAGALFLEVLRGVADGLRPGLGRLELTRAVADGLRRAFPGTPVMMRRQLDRCGSGAVHLGQSGPRSRQGIEIDWEDGSISKLEGEAWTGAPEARLFLQALVAVVQLARRPEAPPRRATGKAIDEGLTLPSGTVIVGSHPRIQEIYRQIKRIAPRRVTVLISGETGTGKELMARALHELSGRREGPFVALNCGALPSGILENELFGHQPGSFTGASSKSHLGLVESASGGSLFLDEVSSMPLDAQSRLLRVLEERSVRRLGESRERPVDIRVIAATNQPLDQLVAQGHFRHDLYHRLHVVRIAVPPLRERRSDIRLLAEYRLKQLGEQEGEFKGLSREAALRLNSYPFPGNVRELFNLMESAYHLSEGDTILPAHFLERLEPAPLKGGDCAEAEDLYLRLCDGRADFWRDVRDRFLSRDLCRRQVRRIVSLGMEEVAGSYRRLIGLFRLPRTDYHRFLAFLTHHRCKVDFRKYRPGSR